MENSIAVMNSEIKEKYVPLIKTTEGVLIAGAAVTIINQIKSMKIRRKINWRKKKPRSTKENIEKLCSLY